MLLLQLLKVFRSKRRSACSACVARQRCTAAIIAPVKTHTQAHDCSNTVGARTTTAPTPPPKKGAAKQHARKAYVQHQCTEEAVPSMPSASPLLWRHPTALHSNGHTKQTEHRCPAVSPPAPSPPPPTVVPHPNKTNHAANQKQLPPPPHPSTNTSLLPSSTRAGWPAIDKRQPARHERALERGQDQREHQER